LGSQETKIAVPVQFLLFEKTKTPVLVPNLVPKIKPRSD
jgi:hypothetical protein